MTVTSIQDADDKIDNTEQIVRLENQIQQIEEKKDKLLELSIAGAIAMPEFKRRNDRFNEQISTIEQQMLPLRQQEQEKKVGIDADLLEKALCEELDFTQDISTEVVGTILDHVVVKEGSDDKQIQLEIYLRLGQTASASFSRDKLVLCDSRSRSTIRK